MSSFKAYSFSPTPEELERQCKDGYHPKCTLGIKDSYGNAVSLEVSLDEIKYWHGRWEFGGWIANNLGVDLERRHYNRETPVEGWYRMLDGRVEI